MYAVISDIHGNLEALEAVLTDVPDGIERIYCLGDVTASATLRSISDHLTACLSAL